MQSTINPHHLLLLDGFPRLPRGSGTPKAALYCTPLGSNIPSSERHIPSWGANQHHRLCVLFVALNKENSAIYLNYFLAEPRMHGDYPSPAVILGHLCRFFSVRHQLNTPPGVTVLA